MCASGLLLEFGDGGLEGVDAAEDGMSSQGVRYGGTSVKGNKELSVGAQLFVNTKALQEIDQRIQNIKKISRGGVVRDCL